eukprot:CAMPEP_0194489186 /NCGR_PEP_ID=MMETSP0253-20130528/8821_1 /TAXON_ID=2966 /ORGANISM="Noctiluca scintillans" /LENGTH=310 /DNA_ID=CAMNT_0039329623 /DNA_START=345 /DNA_END=1279 /DNA_ORIENTATION=-
MPLQATRPLRLLVSCFKCGGSDVTACDILMYPTRAVNISKKMFNSCERPTTANELRRLSSASIQRASSSSPLLPDSHLVKQRTPQKHSASWFANNSVEESHHMDDHARDVLKRRKRTARGSRPREALEERRKATPKRHHAQNLSTTSTQQCPSTVQEYGTLVVQFLVLLYAYRASFAECVAPRRASWQQPCPSVRQLVAIPLPTNRRPPRRQVRRWKPMQLVPKNVVAHVDLTTGVGIQFAPKSALGRGLRACDRAAQGSSRRASQGSFVMLGPKQINLQVAAVTKVRFRAVHVVRKSVSTPVGLVEVNR